jgi:tRNA(fMet)-specific endonuclease VapC
VGFLLDTNVISELVRHPHGRLADRIAAVGEQHVCTSIIVAAELRYGAARKASVRLAAQLEAVLAAIDVLAFETPVDSVYGELRASRPVHRRERPAHCRSCPNIGSHRGHG